MSKENIPSQHTQHQIELPQEIIDSFARFLVPEIRKYYSSKRGQREFAKWQMKQKEQAEDE